MTHSPISQTENCSLAANRREIILVGTDISRGYRYGSKRFIVPASELEMAVGCLSRRFRLRFLCASKWLLYALLRTNLPVLLSLKRFAAPRCVFIFGMILFPL